MVSKIQRRLAGEESGFTLIELLVVIIILGILLAIAVPSYLGFKDRAANNAAKANLRSAIPAAEAYYSDNGTYVGMTRPAMLLIDSGIPTNLSVVSVAAATYCLKDIESGKTWSVQGPGGTYFNSADCT
jgi:type IV pilus assembly protein PilA